MPAILVLSWVNPLSHAPAIIDDVESFERHSRFAVTSVNLYHQPPGQLYETEFAAVVLHWSLFGNVPFMVSPQLEKYLAASSAFKIAFFQDEYRNWAARSGFLRRVGVDRVYSLIAPPHAAEIYLEHGGVSDIRMTIPGYVGDRLVAAARRFAKPDSARKIDVGYRARELPFHMGRQAQEKHGIATEFLARSHGTGLLVDVDPARDSRLYGDDWYRFVANCRAMLGVEAGVSIFDFDGEIEAATAGYLTEHPAADFETVHAAVLRDSEGNVNYRTISPRHFEAAAFDAVQVMYPGDYSGIMRRDEHYVAIEKDWSNFSDVVARLRDPNECRRITTNARAELIDSGRHSYLKFISGFDRDMETLPLAPSGDPAIRTLSRRLRPTWAQRARIAVRRIIPADIVDTARRLTGAL